jgi:hypothetical protein
MTTQNRPLQQRAGKNYPGFLSVLAGTNAQSAKLTAADTVLMEGEGDILLPGALSFISAGDVVSVYNSSGASLDFQLVYVDEFGTELVIDSATVANGSSTPSGTFIAPPFLYLTKGEKILLRVVAPGNPTAGSGVRITRGVTDPVASTLLDVKTYKLQGTEIVLTPPEGVAGGFSIIGLINNIPDPPGPPVGLGVNQYRRFNADGFEFLVGVAGIPAPIPVVFPATSPNYGYFQQNPFESDVSMVLRLTPASASGYVLVKQAIVYPQNSFPVAPAL